MYSRYGLNERRMKEVRGQRILLADAANRYHEWEALAKKAQIWYAE